MIAEQEGAVEERGGRRGKEKKSVVEGKRINECL